jgi:hypothetical protein
MHAFSHFRARWATTWHMQKWTGTPDSPDPDDPDDPETGVSYPAGFSYNPEGLLNNPSDSKA